jgi:hypothetical protein
MTTNQHNEASYENTLIQLFQQMQVLEGNSGRNLLK